MKGDSQVAHTAGILRFPKALQVGGQRTVKCGFVLSRLSRTCSALRTIVDLAVS